MAGAEQAGREHNREDRAARHAQVRHNSNISGEESFEVMQGPSEISVSAEGQGDTVCEPVRRGSAGDDRRIRMSGCERALDNIRIERLWRSLKYEDIYLKRYETVNDLKAGVDAYFRYYNSERFHQSLDYGVPDEMYECFQYDVQEKAA